MTTTKKKVTIHTRDPVAVHGLWFFNGVSVEVEALATSTNPKKPRLKIYLPFTIDPYALKWIWSGPLTSIKRRVGDKWRTPYFLLGAGYSKEVIETFTDEILDDLENWAWDEANTQRKEKAEVLLKQVQTDIARVERELQETHLELANLGA